MLSCSDTELIAEMVARDLASWKDGDGNEEEPSYGEQLTEQQLKQLQGVLTDFKDVVCSEPGRTNLVEHTIESGSPLYGIPHSYCDMEELEKMEQAGVIQP